MRWFVVFLAPFTWIAPVDSALAEPARRLNVLFLISDDLNNSIGNVPKSIGTDGHDDPGSWELELNPAGVDRLEEEPHIFSLVPGQFGGTLSWYASPKSDEHHTELSTLR